MEDTAICSVCGTECERCFVSLDGDHVCAMCYDEELTMTTDVDDTCHECNGRGRTMEGWPCEDCDGTGRCDL